MYRFTLQDLFDNFLWNEIKKQKNTQQMRRKIIKQRHNWWSEIYV